MARCHTSSTCGKSRKTYVHRRLVLYHAPAVVCSQCKACVCMCVCCPQFEDFYEEVFEELATFGEVEAMNVCDNLGDHLVGTCVVLFPSPPLSAVAPRLC